MRKGFVEYLEFLVGYKPLPVLMFLSVLTVVAVARIVERPYYTPEHEWQPIPVEIWQGNPEDIIWTDAPIVLASRREDVSLFDHLGGESRWTVNDLRPDGGSAMLVPRAGETEARAYVRYLQSARYLEMLRALDYLGTRP